MSALGVQADPGGWQHAGSTLAAVVTQLTGELDTADVIGGSGLRPSWSGPVSEAYQDLWSRRKTRYQDLIHQVSRAESALVSFAAALANFQVRASDLERQWLGLGLCLSIDGMSFALPFGHESLTHDVQALLHARLADAESDIAAMWRDITEAVGDVVTALGSILDALADFDLLELGAIGWATGQTWDAMRSGWTGTLQSAIQLLDDDVVDHDASLAADLVDKVDLASDLIEHGLTYVAIGITVAQTDASIRKDGVDRGLENNAGNWASLGAGIALGVGATALIAAGAPEVLVVVGAAVVGAVVCAGVGAVVQSSVNHHRKTATRDLNDIGQGVEQASIWAADHAGLTLQPGS
jgi:hypothetical protein